MNPRTRYLTSSFAAPLAALTLALASATANADLAEVAVDGNQVVTFEYAGDKLRIDMTDQQGYMVVRDNKTYVVSGNNGQMMVFDLNQAMSMFGDMAASSTPALVNNKVVSLKPTGKDETLGEIKGEVYLLEFVDEKGNTDTAEVVLSSDPRALKFRDAVTAMATSLAASSTQKFEAAEDLQQRLEQMKLGVLRYGTDFKVRSIKTSEVADARFVLPAEPTDLSAIGKMMEQMGQPAEAGSAEGGSTVNDALNKAFGKLLGN